MTEVEQGLCNNNNGTRLMSQRRGAAEEPDGGESGYEEDTRPVGQWNRDADELEALANAEIDFLGAADQIGFQQSQYTTAAQPISIPLRVQDAEAYLQSPNQQHSTVSPVSASMNKLSARHSQYSHVASGYRDHRSSKTRV